jgi:hypothetical protein
MERKRIYIDKEADRDDMVVILARNGYTVRQGKEKGGNKVIKFVEYWRE